VVRDHAMVKEAYQIDAAINRVLAVERGAREAVVGCGKAGEREVADAELIAASVAERVEKRVQDAHAIADRGIARALAALSAPPSGGDSGRSMPCSGRIDVIVESLAADLCALGSDNSG
jgi:hypothetical protein